MSEELSQKKSSLKASLLEIMESLDGTRTLFKIRGERTYIAVANIELEQRMALVKIAERNSRCKPCGILKPLPQTWNNCICFFPWLSEDGSHVLVTNPPAFNLMMNGQKYACEKCELRNSHKEEENWTCLNFINGNYREIFEKKMLDVLFSSNKPVTNLPMKNCKCGNSNMEVIVSNEGNYGDFHIISCPYCGNATEPFKEIIDTVEFWNNMKGNRWPKKKAI
jgi:hypothetical protein